ncbi:MAG: hypothetical protein JO353_01760 [Phycisphaerae bacterium]|nr:hypothetical protein [Phycisphaerae bacterium]
MNKPAMTFHLIGDVIDAPFCHGLIQLCNGGNAQLSNEIRIGRDAVYLRITSAMP